MCLWPKACRYWKGIAINMTGKSKQEAFDKKIEYYEYRAQYYETDQMGIIHHSNYIRWMESARLDVMRRWGINYRLLEESGIISPVLSVACEYRSMVRYDDTVLIAVQIEGYNGIKLKLSYTITDKTTGELRLVGESSHCFLNREKRPVHLKKECPNMHEVFMEWLS